MKKFIFSFLIILIIESVCLAGSKVNWRRVEGTPSPVATGDEIAVAYLTGLPEIDRQTTCFSYNVRLAFDDSDIVLKRNMIDQKRGKGIEEVEITRIRYADIKDLLFGYDAIYAAQEGELPTANERLCNNQKLTTFMQIIKSPVVIMIGKGDKRVSFVVSAPDNSAVRLYYGLADRAKLKVKTPMAYKGIVKERAKLDPPPPDSAR